jgi:hypothetical protein
MLFVVESAFLLVHFLKPCVELSRGFGSLHSERERGVHLYLQVIVGKKSFKLLRI